MKKLSMASVAVLIVSALMVPSVSASPHRSARSLGQRTSLAGYLPDAVPGEVIVRFRKGVERGAQQRAVSALGGRVAAGPIQRFSVVKTVAGQSSQDLVRTLESLPEVAFAEPNLLRYASAVPNDTRFADLWGMDNSGQSHAISGSTVTRTGTADADMDVAEAWDTEQGSSDTVVAIMDSGVDVTHPDLAANIWVNDGEIPGNGLDDDGNGYPDDINGWDFADNDSSLLHPLNELEGWDHGTHVAGIVGAVGNNGIGVAGVCPSCKLMVLKMFAPFDVDGDGVDDTMVGDLAAELKAFDYAIRMRADVINGSFGGSIVTSRAERAKVKKGIAAGITMVFAAGNENGDNDLLIPGVFFDEDDLPDMISPAYPASYDLPGIISVAASNDADQNGHQSGCFMALGSPQWPCAFTNWGHDSVDVSAPGVDIVSTLPNNGYAAFDGTSMAAPNVAGLAGLVKSLHPDYTATQVANAIMNSVDRSPSLQNFFGIPDVNGVTGDLTATAGRVNAASALTASSADLYPTSDGSVPGAKALRSSVTARVSWPEDINDIYKKRLAKGSVYKVILDTAGASDLDLQIYKPGTKDIWQFDGSCFTGGTCQVLYYEPTASGDVALKFRARKDGMHYFHVNAWLLETGSYTLKVVKV